MFGYGKRLSDAELRLASLSLAVAELRNDLKATTNSELLKLLEQLQSDLDVTKASLKSAHGKIAIQKRLEPGNGRAAADEVRDEDLDAWLRLQTTNMERN